MIDENEMLLGSLLKKELEHDTLEKDIQMQLKENSLFDTEIQE